MKTFIHSDECTYRDKECFLQFRGEKLWKGAKEKKNILDQSSKDNHVTLSFPVRGQKQRQYCSKDQRWNEIKNSFFELSYDPTSHVKWDNFLIVSLTEIIEIYKTHIIILIMSCRLHGYPWPSLATSSNRSSPLAGLQGYIPYPHIAAVCIFKLVVLLLLGHMRVSIEVHHLWARPCFSSSVLCVWFV